MSTTQRPSETILEGCRPTDATPVTIDAASLDSTATHYLRDLKTSLRADGFVTAELTASTSFDEDCSFSTQETVDRIRNLVDAASFLGADTLTLTVESVENPTKARPALNACVERASRDGIHLDVTGPTSFS